VYRLTRRGRVKLARETTEWNAFRHAVETVLA
jgi:hypothetical protein